MTSEKFTIYRKDAINFTINLTSADMYLLRCAFRSKVEEVKKCYEAGDDTYKYILECYEKMLEQVEDIDNVPISCRYK